MHFGFYITSAAALKWVAGTYSDADLLLNDDDVGGIVCLRSRTDYYWIGSVKSEAEAYEVRSYGPRYCFRATVPSIISWAGKGGFVKGLVESDGSTRFYGTLTRDRKSGH